jgi:hypothetical protein
LYREVTAEGNRPCNTGIQEKQKDGFKPEPSDNKKNGRNIQIQNKE